MTHEHTDIDFPMITEQQANELLDGIVADAIILRDAQNTDLTLGTAEKLQAVFGDAAQMAARLIFLGAVQGFELGVVQQLPGSDRTDILVAALRKVHKPEMFGDCVEDGEVYPCKTARALNLVAGSDPYANAEGADPLAEQFGA